MAFHRAAQHITLQRIGHAGVLIQGQVAHGLLQSSFLD
ncbi:hypothetical protein D560_1773 [Bordetella holmesii ATCC 51541]|nr:hypothetical protein D560_1773 [Bordetella holmesii ATCC 51541]